MPAATAEDEELAEAGPDGDAAWPLDEALAGAEDVAACRGCEPQAVIMQLNTRAAARREGETGICMAASLRHGLVARSTEVLAPKPKQGLALLWPPFFGRRLTACGNTPSSTLEWMGIASTWQRVGNWLAYVCCGAGGAPTEPP